MVENVRMSHYYNPTPVQAYAIPALLKGHDVIAVAQTGTSLLFIIVSNTDID